MQYVSITFRTKNALFRTKNALFRAKNALFRAKKDSFFFFLKICISYFFYYLCPLKNNDVMDIKKILDKIAKRRKKKGYSYENMAED